jgi:hypothetical protein
MLALMVATESVEVLSGSAGSVFAGGSETESGDSVFTGTLLPLKNFIIKASLKPIRFTTSRKASAFP